MTEIRKIGYSVNISRESAIDHGLIEPAPEERAVLDERAQQYALKVAEAWRINDDAMPKLDAITDPASRIVLDLHHRTSDEFPQCDGCEFSGYEADPPQWPCSTVEAIAKHHGIALPDGWMLWRRP